MGVGASAAAAGVWALSALIDPLEPRAAPQPLSPAPFEPSTASSNLPNKITGSFISSARGGVKTNWVIALPPGQTSQSGFLRPVIALHGKDGNANMMLDCGVEDGLARLVKEGRPPFAVVGVDGGSDSYWHKRADGTDSGAMVLEELLPMLSSMALTPPGWASWGGRWADTGRCALGPSWARRGPRGSARSARRCTPRTPAAPRGAFDSYEDYMANSVLGVPALSQIPLRVDCGTGDRFYFATKQFVSQLKTPPAGSFSAGGHDIDYWRQQMPGELAWLAC